MLLDNKGHIKLTDFGLSKIKENEKDLTFTFCGTPEYLAPEIIRGEGYDKEIDFWALVSRIKYTFLEQVFIIISSNCRDWSYTKC